MRKVFFDLETGGLDPNRHPIIQIAAIAVDVDLNELDVFEAKVDFDMAAADPDALAKNSYNREVWDRESVSPLSACNELSRFLKPFTDVQMISPRTGMPYYVAQLIGHNSHSFDAPFLQAMYRQQKQFLPAGFLTLCTLQKALHYFNDRPDLRKPENFKLEGLCKYFGVPLEGAHDALADVRATLAMYRALRAAEMKELIPARAGALA